MATSPEIETSPPPAVSVADVVGGLVTASGVQFYPTAIGIVMKYRRPKDDQKGGLLPPLSWMTEIDVDNDALAAEQGIGGYGITRRSLKEIEEDLPGVSGALAEAPDKIVFLGNGLSVAPIEVVRNRIREKSLPDIVVVDCFDYQTLRTDLLAAKSALAEHGLSSPRIEADIARCELILNVAGSGLLRTVQHIVGDGEPPTEIRGADVVVNCFGPPKETIAAQLACLKPDGLLFSSYV